MAEKEYYISKRNGNTELFDINKLQKWFDWASKNNIEIESIVEKAMNRCPNGVSTEDFHKAMIDTCVDETNTDYLKIAARLLVGSVWKKAFHNTLDIKFIGEFPSLMVYVSKMVELGYYEAPDYTEAEICEIGKHIDHNKDLGYTYTTIKQISDKYLIKNIVDKKLYETPQFMFVGIAMAICQYQPKETKVADAINLYKYLSDLKINAPTPYMTNLRTSNKGIASCCIFFGDDTADSIEAANSITYKFTTANAGIGGCLQTRSAGDGVRNGQIKHLGKIPYYKYFEAATKSTKQQSRSGAVTMYYTCMDPEIIDLLKLKSVKTPEQKAVRNMDYSLCLNKTFLDAVFNDENWMLISCKDAPDLYESFYSNDIIKFEQLYNFYVNSDKNKQFVKAKQIANEFLINRQETGRVYAWFADNANSHTTFKDRIHSSNLCEEVNLPTSGFKSSFDLYKHYSESDSGEVAMCFLAAICAGRVTEEEYESVAYYTLLMADTAIDIMTYPFKHVESTAKARRSIGIGLTNVANAMARKMVSYSSKAGKQYAHELAEMHSYYLHKASLRLAKEKGKAEWMHKTKYPEGWLPIDTYNKNVNNVVKPNYKYDWESLRKEIVNFGGIRNSTLVAHMPCESSSGSSSTTNGLYPIRDRKVIKKSGNNVNVFLAPDYDDPLVNSFYDIAWEVPTKDLIEFYAIIQKFTCQGISADFYIDFTKQDKISLKEWLQYLEYSHRMGLKSWYYTNSKTITEVKDKEICESCSV